MTDEERQRIDTHLTEIHTKVLEVNALVGGLQDELHIQGLGGLPEDTSRYFDTRVQPLTGEQGRQLEPLVEDLHATAKTLETMSWIAAVLDNIQRGRDAAELSLEREDQDLDLEL